MRKSLKCLIVPFALVLGGLANNPLAAQTITPPNAYEFPFNKVKMQRPTHTSNYSTRIYDTILRTDFYISAWSTREPGANSEVIYTFTRPDDPTTVFNQASIIMQDASDIEVGYYFDVNMNQNAVAIAYYKNGVGHMMDIYRLHSTPSYTLSYVQTIPLAPGSQYGRIRMESHYRYGIAVVWENPGAGIQAIVGKSGNWGTIKPLGGPNVGGAPDVAFSHPDNGQLDVLFVYKNGGGMQVSKFDFEQEIASPGSAPIIPVDFFNIPGQLSHPVIDCPDHYNKETWAYTFTDGNNIFVRHMESNFMGAPQTTIVNDGSLGNLPTANRRNMAYSPTLHYGDGAYSAGGYTGQIHVGWYNVDNVANGNFIGGGRYIGVELRTTGGSLINDPDYMGISQNAQDVLPDSYSGIAFSKMGEGHWYNAPMYMYTTYFTETAPGAGDYYLNHAFHKWSDTRFRGNNTPPPPHPDCGQHTPVAQMQAQAAEMNVYPNPFKSTLTNNVTMNAEGLFELTLTDINGRQVGSKQVRLNKGRHMVEMSKLGHLTPGTYFLSSFVDGKINGTKTVVKQ